MRFRPCLCEGYKLFSASTISERSFILSFHFCFGSLVLPTNCAAFCFYLTACLLPFGQQQPSIALHVLNNLWALRLRGIQEAKQIQQKNLRKKRSSIFCRGINKINYSGKKATGFGFDFGLGNRNAKMANWQSPRKPELQNQSRKSQEQQRIEI